MEQDTAQAAQSDAAARERSLIEDLRKLARDGRAFAEAELAYQQSRAAFAGQEARSLAGLGLGAFALLFFALMALTVGILIGLSREMGPWLATLIVVAVLLALAGLCALVAKSRASRLLRLLRDERT